MNKIIAGIAAVGVAAGLSVGLTDSADAGVYSNTKADNPLYWGCINPATSALVGGRFYEYDGDAAQPPFNRYPGCNSWATLAHWNQGVDALQESVRTSVPNLAIDGAPGVSGNGGSGGWGWDNTANAAVTLIKVGDSKPLTVTAMQGIPEANGSITLSWNPDDFDLVGGAGDASATKTSLGAGEASFAYTDFAHTDKSDSFTFKALSTNPNAVVTATVTTAAGTATATFPIAIQ